MLKWLDTYLENISCSEEMIRLIRNFFNTISGSEHFIRNEVNDLLFEILIKSIKFRIIGTAKNKVVTHIDEKLLWDIKQDFLMLISEKLVIDAPDPPPKLANPFAKKTPNKPKTKLPEPKDE